MVECKGPEAVAVQCFDSGNIPHLGEEIIALDIEHEAECGTPGVEADIIDQVCRSTST